mmetsp:Transcript_12726/g.29374  ORF Transcript_12726/g.29374 Transcript_12726/m.29374 type:complete len:278 (-) Transcript_12726:113-946(-)
MNAQPAYCAPKASMKRATICSYRAALRLLFRVLAGNRKRRAICRQCVSTGTTPSRPYEKSSTQSATFRPTPQSVTSSARSDASSSAASESSHGSPPRSASWRASLYSRGARYPQPSCHKRSSLSAHSCSVDGKLWCTSPYTSQPRAFSSNSRARAAIICMLRLMLLFADPINATSDSRRESTLTTRTPGRARVVCKKCWWASAQNAGEDSQAHTLASTPRSRLRCARSSLCAAESNPTTVAEVSSLTGVHVRHHTVCESSRSSNMFCPSTPTYDLSA